MDKIFQYGFCLIILLSAQTVIARDVNDEYAVFGSGGKTCKSFSLANNLGGRQYDIYESWLLGFFSAYNESTPSTYNILGARRLDQIIAWLEEYCQANPNEFFVSAAATLVARLYPTRQNLSPNRSNIISNFQ